MAAIASFQALSLAPACAKRNAGASKKSLKAGSSSSFVGASLAAKRPVRAAAAAGKAAGGLKVEARFDAGVGVFGNKAGMTQLFTEDGLCVPVTVIAVQAGNVVTQVSRDSFSSAREKRNQPPHFFFFSGGARHSADDDDVSRKSNWKREARRETTRARDTSEEYVKTGVRGQGHCAASPSFACAVVRLRTSSSSSSGILSCVWGKRVLEEEGHRWLFL